MALTVRFRYAAQDLLEAQVAMREFRTVERWAFRLLFPAFALGIVAGGYLIIKGFVVVGIAWIVAFVLLPATVIMMPGIQARRAMQKFPYLREDIVAEFADDGLRLVTTQSNAFLSWNLFVAVRETNNVLLLLRQDSHMQIFPKRAFSADELSSIRMFLEKNVHSTEKEE